MREPTFYKQQKVNENKRSTEEEEDRGKKGTRALVTAGRTYEKCMTPEGSLC